MRPLKADKVSTFVRRVLDAETTGLGTAVPTKSPLKRPPRALVCVVRDGAHDGRPGEELRRFWGQTSIQDAVDHLVELTEDGTDVECYAHFGGSFDFRLILGWYFKTYKVKFKVTKTGSLPLSIEGKPAGGGRLRLVDSYRLLPGKLADIGKAVGFEKGEWSHDWHSDREYAGGPPIPGKFHHRLHAAICYEALAKYCVRDCEVLDKGLDQITAFARSRGVEPRLTIASTASASIRLQLTDETVAEAPMAIEDVGQRACFGGRVEVFGDRCDAAKVFDLQSSYPAAMLNPLPWRYTKTTGDWNGDVQTLVECTVEVPDCYLPVLPYRSPLTAEAGRVYFPTGTWSGVWSGFELAYAIRVGAAKLTSVAACHYFESSTILRDFAKDIWESRRVAKGFEKYALKIWMNGGGYGKLVESGEKDEVIVRPDKVLCDKHRTKPRRPNERCGCMAPMAPSLGMYSYKFKRQPAFRAPWAGAAILGIARVQLHERLLQKAVDLGLEIRYCDTDSTTCIGGDIPSEKGTLGAPALERVVSSGRFAAAKLYGYICEACDAKDKDGNPKRHPHEVVKAKGFTGMKLADLLALLECPSCQGRGYRPGSPFGCPTCQGGSLCDPGDGHKPFTFERSEGFGEALKRRKDIDYRRIIISRSLRDSRPKRPDGGKRPWSVDELAVKWVHSS